MPYLSLPPNRAVCFAPNDVVRPIRGAKGSSIINADDVHVFDGETSGRVVEVTSSKPVMVRYYDALVGEYWLAPEDLIRVLVNNKKSKRGK
ncbi:hypothetical protein [Neptunicella sp.]|uniref:hypothetical protein n=1 Tax=Neptunicella sp. TaxID=2125986 RepID=UPI003F68F2A3